MPLSATDSASAADRSRSGTSAPRMRIVLHDYSGHPFQVQLARVLASRGHEVLHLHSSRFQTPKGPLSRRADDPATLTLEGIDIGEVFQKYSFIRRLVQERRYGRLLTERMDRFRPDAVVSANTPLDAQATAQRWSRQRGIGFVFWLQDIYSVAIERTLHRRLWLLGDLAARRFVDLERRSLIGSDAVVAITDDFIPALTRFGVPAERVSVVENWAPLDQIEPLPRMNAWSRERGLDGSTTFVYAGTLGLKHDPSLLMDLAVRLPEATVVVVSEGMGADWLREHGSHVPNLRIEPFQPYDRLPEVLATADVLVAILEPDAGAFSVPSKVLSSLAAGRAILGALPHSNLAARTIVRVGAGSVVEPWDRKGFVMAGESLMADPVRRQAAGDAARAYAEATFDIGRIADRFEVILEDAVTHARRRASTKRSPGSLPSTHGDDHP